MAGRVGIQWTFCIYYTQISPGPCEDDYPLTRGGTVLDVRVIARSSQVSGTCRVSRVREGEVAPMTDLIPAHTDGRTASASIIDDAAYTVIPGDALRFSISGEDTLVDVAVMLIPPVASPIPGFSASPIRIG